MTGRSTEEWIGRRFHRLTVIEEVDGPRKGRFFRCRCDCGSTKIVYGAHLKSGSTKGCGCARKGVNVIHGLTLAPEYRAWSNAKDRCDNPKNSKFHIYGGRGIKMCQEWRSSFEAFIKDMGRRPGEGFSLDRINSDGDYEPSNCRWATIIQQNNNRSFNRHVVVGGVMMTISEASKASDTPHPTILGRLKRGWTEEEAVYGKTKRS